MEPAEASKMIEVLEQRYFEMHHRAKRAEAELMERKGDDADGASTEPQEVRACLEAVECEKRAILNEILQIEDRLLEDD